MKLKTLVIGLLVLAGLAQARGFESEHDSLPPWIQYYNKLKGEPKLVPFYPDFNEPESLNVRLVGKWGRGPAARVTGRDSLVYVAMGSEVAVFNCVDASNPRVINEIQCRYVVDKAILKDTFLYAVLQGGVEVFNIANPRSVTRIRYLNISAVDMCIEDSLAYTVDADSFKVYRLVRPDSFQRLGACADSGYYLAVNQGFGYACDRWGLYVIDATNPASPHQATILTNAQTWSVLVDSDYCYYATAGASPNYFRIADVSDPYHPAEVSSISSIASYDLFKLDDFVYGAGYYIVDVSNPDLPGVVGSLVPGGIGVWTRSPFTNSFLAASYRGLAVVDIADPVHPHQDTTTAGASESYDISPSPEIAFVANTTGMKVLGLSNPAVPIQIGSYDTTGTNSLETYAVRSRDSFAFLATQVWRPTNFRVLDVTDSTNPVLVATCTSHNGGEALIVHDTLAYVAEDYWFLIYSIANPRSPRLVGSCAALDMVGGLCLQGNYAYEESGFGLGIIDISDPSHPQLVSTTPGHPTNSWGVAVRDSFAFVPSAYDSLWVFNVANPLAPTPVTHVWLGNSHGYDVALDGNYAFVGCHDLRVFDISDPTRPVPVGFYSTPYRVRRVAVHNGLVYAACFGAGVCIFETLQTGVAEPPRRHSASEDPSLAVEVSPNPATRFTDISLNRLPSRTPPTIVIYSATGTKADVSVARLPSSGKNSYRVDLSRLTPGAYFVSLGAGSQQRSCKLVKN